jgi:ubiquitin-protein ligase
MSNERIKQVRTSRILKEIKEAHKSPFDIDNSVYKINEGIFLHIDDEDISNIKILIIGPSETPYHNGYYFFKYEYTNNYPFEPPKVKFISTDGIIRFNPNLYAGGKVCLSILGTWQGPPWEPCMSISDVCFYLRSILNSNPLENEPGFEKRKDAVMTNYIKYVDINNYYYAINYLIKNKPYVEFNVFNNTINKLFIKNFIEIEKYLQNEVTQDKIENRKYINLHISPYNKYITTNYSNILNDLYINISVMYYLNEIHQIFNEEEMAILKTIKSEKGEVIQNTIKSCIYKKLISIIENNFQNITESPKDVEDIINLLVLTGNKAKFDQYIKIINSKGTIKTVLNQNTWDSKLKSTSENKKEFEKKININNIIDICSNFASEKVDEYINFKIIIGNEQIDLINYTNLIDLLKK